VESKKVNVECVSLKKRRLSQVLTTQRPAKAYKYEETVVNIDYNRIADPEILSMGHSKCLAVEDDRGVSSSCEALCSIANKLPIPVCQTSKDEPSNCLRHPDNEFIYNTQALEVTTSNLELDDEGVDGEAEVSTNHLVHEENSKLIFAKPIDLVEIAFGSNPNTSNATMNHLKEASRARISVTDEIVLNSTANENCVMNKLAQKTLRKLEDMKSSRISTVSACEVNSTCMHQIVECESSELTTQEVCAGLDEKAFNAESVLFDCSASVSSSQINTNAVIIDQEQSNKEIAAICTMPKNEIPICMPGSINQKSSVGEQKGIVPNEVFYCYLFSMIRSKSYSLYFCFLK